MLISMLAENALHHDFWMFPVLSLGFYFTTYIAAFIFVIFVLKPLGILTSMIFYKSF